MTLKGNAKSEIKSKIESVIVKAKMKATFEASVLSLCIYCPSKLEEAFDINFTFEWSNSSPPEGAISFLYSLSFYGTFFHKGNKHTLSKYSGVKKSYLLELLEGINKRPDLRNDDETKEFPEYSFWVTDLQRG